MTVIDFKQKSLPQSPEQQTDDGGMSEYSSILHDMYCQHGHLALSHCAHALRVNEALGAHVHHQWLEFAEEPVFNVFHKLLLAVNYTLMPDKKSLRVERFERDTGIVYEFTVLVERGFELKATVIVDSEGENPDTDLDLVPIMRKENVGNRLRMLSRSDAADPNHLPQTVLNALSHEFAMVAYATTGLKPISEPGLLAFDLPYSPLNYGWRCLLCFTLRTGSHV